MGDVIGNRLREERELKGLKQPDLAERVGVSTNQIVKWEKEKSNPGSDKLKLIAKELNVSSDYLLGLVDEKAGYLTESALTPKEQRLLDAYRQADWQRILYELATDEHLKEKTDQKNAQSTNKPTSHQ